MSSSQTSLPYACLHHRPASPYACFHYRPASHMHVFITYQPPTMHVFITGQPSPCMFSSQASLPIHVFITGQPSQIHVFITGQPSHMHVFITGQPPHMHVFIIGQPLPHACFHHRSALHPCMLLSQPHITSLPISCTFQSLPHIPNQPAPSNIIFADLQVSIFTSNFFKTLPISMPACFHAADLVYCPSFHCLLT